ncbi:MSHA biogenesis protein MshJ [Aliiglaciecola litoralis]|uniref:MSHA biogenesis protein MshJ n=1 Tax=Aliiglaciecola litoralis TaxID=582857 RepID=A0ABP3WTK4_9ALTE
MSQSYAQKYQELQVKFLKLTQRERMLALIAALSCVLLGGYVFFIEPKLVLWDKQKMEEQRQAGEIERLDTEINALQQALLDDPNTPIKARLGSIQKQIIGADNALAAQTKDLVPANQMSKLLESVFAQFDRLKLMEMRSIAPTAMLAIDDKNELTDVNLYQHGVQLTLQGSYFDIQKYLQRVEALPYQFYWKKFSYQVDEYPNAQVQIEIYTLSTNRAFIGVWNNG